MARITSQLAVEQIGNRYNLVLIASLRARELKSGHMPLVNNKDKNGHLVTAIREIEEGKVGIEYLEKIRHEKKTKNRRGMEKR